MEKFSVLLCDEDQSYVNAVMRFLLATQKKISISAYTDGDAFKLAEGSFDLALLSKKFLNLREEGACIIEMKEIFFLSDVLGETSEKYRTFYKFQNMSVLSETIFKLSHSGKNDFNSENPPIKIGVYSPIFHELRLPFSLTLSHVLSDRQKILFVDLEQFSLLPDMIGDREMQNDLYDIFYLMESNREDDFTLDDYVFYYEGVGFLPTFSNPENMAWITEEQWLRLFDAIERAGFGCVVLFDQIIQGCSEVLSSFDELVLLGRQEDYCDDVLKRCSLLMRESRTIANVRDVRLNMSAGNLIGGSYNLKHLMEGNMASFVRNEFKGTIAI